MGTIFTRAKAAKKVIDLMDRHCAIKRKKLRCDARLESDLGVVGDDTFELLQAMRQDLEVDLTGFDDDDHITPEGTPPLQILLMIVSMPGIFAALIAFVPEAPPWLLMGVALVATFTILRAIGRMVPKPTPELTIRDLVLSVEAGRWLSPKQNKRMESNG